MKSILADFRRPKIAILTILEALNFYFWNISHLQMSNLSKSSKFKAAKMFKMAVFGASKWPKIEFTENLSARKFLKSPHCEFLIFRFSLKNLKTRQNGHFSKTYVNHPKLILQDFINFFISRNFLPRSRCVCRNVRFQSCHGSRCHYVRRFHYLSHSTSYMTVIWRPSLKFSKNFLLVSRKSQSSKVIFTIHIFARSQS